MIDVLWRACHPLPAAAVTLLSAVLAYALGEPAGVSLLAGASIGLTQLSVGWANDALDAKRDAAVGRTDKPLVSRADARGTVMKAAWTAAALTALVALMWGWPRGVLLLLCLVAAQLYNWPLKNTVASALPYLVAFGTLPAFLAPGSPLWVIGAAALLGGAAHFVNVIPDLEQDAQTGIRGLPHRLGAKPSLYLASVLLLAATALLVFGGQPPLWASAVAVLAAVSLPVISHFAPPRTAFKAVLAVAAIDVLLLVTSRIT